VASADEGESDEAAGHADRAEQSGPAKRTKPAEPAEPAEAVCGPAEPVCEPAEAVCGSCGNTSAPAVLLTWTVETGPSGPRYTCLTCTRRHLRAMEARLRPEHW